MNNSRRQNITKYRKQIGKYYIVLFVCLLLAHSVGLTLIETDYIDERVSQLIMRPVDLSAVCQLRFLNMELQ